MEFLESAAFSKKVEKSLVGVLDGLGERAKVWWQRTRLLTIGRQRYNEFIIRSVGKFPLFGTSRTVSVNEKYVRVELSPDIMREVYRSKDLIESEILDQQRGLTDRSVPQGRTAGLWDALESTSDGFALLGVAGSGKTTGFRYLTVQAASGRKVHGKRRVPLLITVRDLARSGGSILEAAADFLSWLEIQHPLRVLVALLRSGAVLLLVDGLDETSKEHQEAIVNELLRLTARYPDSIFCVSSRPYSLSVGLTGYTKWETRPLKLEERVNFVCKWFSDVDPGKGRRLLSISEDRPELLDIGGNPLLLSIVCALFHNDLDIPQNRDELYDRAIDGLLGGWDAFRNIARASIFRDLSINRRRILLSWLAAELFQKGEIVFTAEDVRNIGTLGRAAQHMRSEELPSEEVLKALYNDFGILTERAPGIYSFSHLSLHEHLVARFIVDHRTELELVQLYGRHASWFSVVCMVARILPRADHFLMALWSRIKLSDPQDIALWLAVWKAEPICKPETVAELMRLLALALRSALDQIDCTFSVSRGTLFGIPQSPSGLKRGSSSDLEDYNEYMDPLFCQQLLCNVPDILEIFSKCQSSWRTLELENLYLFKVLAGAGVSTLEGVEFLQSVSDKAEDAHLQQHGTSGRIKKLTKS